MSDNQTKTIEELNKEILELRERIKRIETFILDNFRKTDPVKYILEPDDDSYEIAVSLVKEYKTASVSLLQRKMKIGYAKATKLMEELEKSRIIGPANGANPRKILKK